MASGVLGFFFGNKPKVPQLKSVNPDAVQQQTISGNMAALPGAEQLASEVNQFNMDELTKALEFALPGGLKQAQANISAQLSGMLDPQDTQALIRNSTAAGYGKGFGSSFGAGGIGRNLVLRDLGISVENQKQKGLSNFLTLAQQTKVPQFDPTSMFLSPTQRLSFEQKSAEDSFNRDWLESQVAAAPNPAGAWTAQLVMEFVKAAGKGIGAAA